MSEPGHPRAASLAACAAYVALWGWCASDLQRRWDRYADASEPLLVARCVVTGIALLCAGALLFAVWRNRSAVVGPLRGLMYCVAAAFVAGTVGAQLGETPDDKYWIRACFFLALPAGIAVWAGLALRGARAAAPSRGGPRAWDLLLANAIAAVFLVEVCLGAWGRLRPSPLFFGSNPQRNIEAMRALPGAAHLGATRNSGGYPDDEFFVAGPRDLVIGVLADSFGTGVVPHDHHFTTVAERRLQRDFAERYERVALHNFGISAIGMAEYARLLETEVEATRPHFALLCVFVGNDISHNEPFDGDAETLRYSLHNWFVWVVPRRLATLRSERAQREAESPKRDALSAPPPASAAPLAHILDASLEQPTFSEQRFLDVEAGRLPIANPSNPRTQRDFRDFERALDHFERALGERLWVLVIPDEFQVNDSLWAKLLAAEPDPSAFVRDSPQAWIRAWCDARGVPCLDPLPQLRDAERTGRTYHLRDTHWNARGNRVAGELLAEWAASLLGGAARAQ